MLLGSKGKRTVVGSEEEEVVSGVVGRAASVVSAATSLGLC